MEVGQMGYEKFVEEAKKSNVVDVTKEEWEQHAKDRKWSFMTAITRIRNQRKGVGRPKVTSVLVGYPLGGRDLATKTIDIEDSKSQFVIFLDEQDKLWELTQYGHFKGAHMNKCEVEIETTTKQVKDNTYVNDNVRSVTVHDQRIKIERLAKLAKPIENLKNDELYKPVIIDGYISGGFEGEPIWGDEVDEDGKSQIVGHYNLKNKDQPCFQFKMAGGGKSLRVRLSPVKHSEKVVELDDVINVIADNKPEDLTMTYSKLRTIVVGHVSAWNSGENVDFITIDATAVIPHPEQKEEKVEEKPEEKEPVTEQPKEDFKAEEYKAPTDDIKKTLEELKKRVDEAYGMLGGSITVASLRETVEIPPGVADSILQKLINNRKAGKK